MSVTAPVTNIARCSLHDGPGVRTVVYLKGCGLRCAWCHNPETLDGNKRILYIKSKCIHCGKCIELCPEHHRIDGDDMVFDREGCTACGRCAASCPSLALNLCGETKTVEEVFEEIEKDAHYYTASGGGVTFSGGECLLHSEFVFEVAKLCRENHISTVVESAFFVPWESVERVLPYIDLFYADLKIADSSKHRLYTGQGNENIIANISKLSRIHHNVIVRIPLIPGVNDSMDDIAGFGQIIKTFGEGIKAVELLKYNNLAESKYDIAGMEYTKFADNSQTDEDMKSMCEALEKICDISCYFA